MDERDIRVGSTVRSRMYMTMIGKVVAIFPNGTMTIDVDGVCFTSEIGRWMLVSDP